MMACVNVAGRVFLVVRNVILDKHHKRGDVVLLVGGDKTHNKFNSYLPKAGGEPKPCRVTGEF